MAKAHLQPQRERRDAAVRQRHGACARVGLAAVGNLPREFGAPLTVCTGTDRALSGIQATTQRANQVLDDPYGDGTINNWLNPAAFAQPALGTYGNSMRNAYDGPGRQVVDLSLVRSFRFGNGQRLEARVEAFNAFNGSCWKTRTRRCPARPSGASPHRAIRASCSSR